VTATTTTKKGWSTHRGWIALPSVINGSTTAPISWHSLVKLISGGIALVGVALMIDRK
jgi:hypothetical protein